MDNLKETGEMEEVGQVMLTVTKVTFSGNILMQKNYIVRLPKKYTRLIKDLIDSDRDRLN